MKKNFGKNKTLEKTTVNSDRARYLVVCPKVLAATSEVGVNPLHQSILFPIPITRQHCLLTNSSEWKSATVHRNSFCKNVCFGYVRQYFLLLLLSRKAKQTQFRTIRLHNHSLISCKLIVTTATTGLYDPEAFKSTARVKEMPISMGKVNVVRYVGALIVIFIFLIILNFLTFLSGCYVPSTQQPLSTIK